MDTTRAWVRRAPFRPRAPLGLAAAKCHISARTALPGSRRGWSELARRAGAGPRPAGVAGWRATRRRARRHGHQSAGGLGSRSCRGLCPAGNQMRHIWTAALRKCAAPSRAGLQLSTSPTSSPGHLLFIHFPAKANKDPSFKLSLPPR